MAKLYEALMRAFSDRYGLDDSPTQSIDQTGIPNETCFSADNVRNVDHTPAFDDKNQEVTFFDVGEEMAYLLESIETMLPRTRNKIVQFIGSGEGNGATTLASEFARVAASNVGLSVLLTDVCRLSSSLEDFICQKQGISLLEAARDEVGIEKILNHSRDNTYFDSSLTNFRPPAIDTGDAQSVVPFWEDLRARFDLTVIDSTPVHASSDGLAVLPEADSVVLVFESDEADWTMAQNLEEVGLALVLDLVGQGTLLPQKVVKCQGVPAMLLVPVRRLEA